MRNVIRTISVVFVFLAIFSISSYGQAKPSGRIGLINLFALGEKGGITKYMNALKKLDTEFATEVKSLQTMAKSIDAKTGQFKTMRQNASKAGSAITPAMVNAKAQEIEQLRRTAKFKQEDLQARVNTRRSVLIGPVWNDMRVAMKAYAEQKGYALILDGSKLQESGILMAFDNKSDVTKDFIVFYNARPGSAGSARR